MFIIFILPHLSGVMHTSFLIWLGLIFKCYPCCMIAEIMIATAQIGEFIAAMAKWKVPRNIVIPIAIMFRY
jgi:energy-coupling factor transport system permease protein